MTTSRNHSKDQMTSHDLYKTGMYSDLTLRCDGQDFRVHRFIVVQSPVFRPMLDSNFQEATDRVIDITIVDKLKVDRMLLYLYTGDYEDHPRSQLNSTLQDSEVNTASNPSAQASMHAAAKDVPQDSAPATMDINHKYMNNLHVMIAADYYNLPSLTALAYQKMSIRIPAWQQAGFAKVIEAMYERVPRQARGAHDIFVRLAVERLSELKDDQDFLACIAQFPDFAQAFLNELCVTHNNELGTLTHIHTVSMEILRANSEHEREMDREMASTALATVNKKKDDALDQQAIAEGKLVARDRWDEQRTEMLKSITSCGGCKALFNDPVLVAAGGANEARYYALRFNCGAHTR